jgi:hypothetical protein
VIVSWDVTGTLTVTGTTSVMVTSTTSVTVWTSVLVRVILKAGVSDWEEEGVSRGGAYVSVWVTLTVEPSITVV